jgi:hypothetical protein
MISIFTICTGKYVQFFDNFYESAERHFLKNMKKEYIVFTDGDLTPRSNVKVIHQQKLGWPYDTMMRFHMFNKVQPKGDYVYFFNANMLVVDDVGEEVIPNRSDDYLVGVLHPCYFKSTTNSYPYERRTASKFFIPFGYGRCYYQGCFNGGSTKEFMEMSRVLATDIDEDLNNGIIPIWHDESALNHYYSYWNPLSLPPSYAYPESYQLDMPKKIIQLDKSKLGGHEFLRS